MKTGRVPAHPCPSPTGPLLATMSRVVSAPWPTSSPVVKVTWGGGCASCPWPTPPAQPQTVEIRSGDPALGMGTHSKTPHRFPGSKRGHGVTRSQPGQQPAPSSSKPHRLSHKLSFLHPSPGNHPQEMPPKATNRVTRAPKYSSRKKCFLNNFHFVLSRSGLPRLSRFES